MFRAYSPEVLTTKDMSHFMNSNDWQRDPLSLGITTTASKALLRVFRPASATNSSLLWG
jgi:hypothetical protein